MCHCVRNSLKSLIIAALTSATITTTTTPKSLLFNSSVGTVFLQQCLLYTLTTRLHLLHFILLVFHLLLYQWVIFYISQKKALEIKQQGTTPQIAASSVVGAHTEAPKPLKETSRSLGTFITARLNRRVKVSSLHMVFRFLFDFLHSYCCCQVHEAHSENSDEVPRWRWEVSGTVILI